MPNRHDRDPEVHLPGGSERRLSVPDGEPGQSITFQNHDAVPGRTLSTRSRPVRPVHRQDRRRLPDRQRARHLRLGPAGLQRNQGSFGNAPAADRDTWRHRKDLPTGTYSYFCRVHPFMRGGFRVEPQANPHQTLKAKKKQTLSKAAVTETVSRAATVQLQARLKGGKNSAGSSASRSLSQALDANGPRSRWPRVSRRRSSSSSRRRRARGSGRRSQRAAQ